MKAVADAPDAYYIVNETGLDPETRALKNGETFGVFDVFGDIGNGAGQGLYHDGTRHLSLCRLRLPASSPLAVSSTGRPCSRSGPRLVRAPRVACAGTSRTITRCTAGSGPPAHLSLRT